MTWFTTWPSAKGVEYAPHEKPAAGTFCNACTTSWPCATLRAAVEGGRS